MKSGNVTKDAFDQRNLDDARRGEASLAVDQAAIDAATLNLGYAEIRAPFAGRLGRNLKPPRARWSGPATGALNTLMQLDPALCQRSTPSEAELMADIEKARAGGRQGRGRGFDDGRRRR